MLTERGVDGEQHHGKRPINTLTMYPGSYEDKLNLGVHQFQHNCLVKPGDYPAVLNSGAASLQASCQVMGLTS